MIGLLEAIMGGITKGASGGLVDSLGGLGDSMGANVDEGVSSSGLNDFFSSGAFEGDTFGGQSSGGGMTHSPVEQIAPEPLDARGDMLSAMSQAGISNPSASQLQPNGGAAYSPYQLPMGGVSTPALQEDAQTNEYAEALKRIKEAEDNNGVLFDGTGPRRLGQNSPALQE